MVPVIFTLENKVIWIRIVFNVVYPIPRNPFGRNGVSLRGVVESKLGKHLKMRLFAAAKERWISWR